ncbi:hypothetical protein IWW38_004706, partial [Coemansia aciculifera]
MLLGKTQGLGPAGVRRFPYLGTVMSAVRSRRAEAIENDRDHELLAAITKTVQDVGSVNTTAPMESNRDRMHSHYMLLYSVVQSLRRRGHKEWQKISVNRVRTLLDKYPKLISVVGPEPVAEANLEADRGLVVQQTIDACSVVERVYAEKLRGSAQKFLPTFDDTRNAQFNAVLSHSELHSLDSEIAELSQQHWQTSAQNVSEVDALVARVEGLARLANPGSY